MKVRPSISSSKQPRCFVGDGLIMKSGHWEAELSELEMSALVKTLSEAQLLNPKRFGKLKAIISGEK